MNLRGDYRSRFSVFAEFQMSRFQPKPGFPPDVQEIFDALRQEVAYLHSNWDTFKQLYGTQDSVDALNGVAPGAFH